MLAFYGSCVKADVVVSIILEQRVAGVDVSKLYRCPTCPDRPTRWS